MHLYVYYDVQLDEASRVRDGIRSMQSRLNAEHRVQGRLLRRACESGGDKQRETWMEIYEQVDRAFEAHLKNAFEASGLKTLLAGPRHIERFADFD